MAGSGDIPVRQPTGGVFKMKETFYFTHDYGARNDPELVKVVMKYGMEGVGVYWCLVEMMYENGGYLLLSECDTYAFALRVESDVIGGLVRDTNLFQTTKDKFYSESIIKRLQERDDKSVKARESAFARWHPDKQDANVKRTQCDSNAIKEKKLKEKKLKEKKLKPINPGSGVSLHNSMIKIYSEWYNDKVGVKYPFQGGQDGSAIKAIIVNLRSAISEKNKKEATDDDVLNGWKFLLDSYDKWESFYQAQLKLSQILSNLANIYINIKGIRKDGKYNKTQAGKLTDKDWETLAKARRGE